MDKLEDSKEEGKPNKPHFEEKHQNDTEDKENKESKSSKLEIQIENKNEQNGDNQKQDNHNNNANGDINVPSKGIEDIRNQKKLAMNRMRNNVKDTLFKGITKKVNPEGSFQNAPTQGSGTLLNLSQNISQSGVIRKGSNFNEQEQQNSNYVLNEQKDGEEAPPDSENYFKLQPNLTNSVKMDQCPRIELNFASNIANKFRMNDPIMNKILDDRDSTPQKDSSIINQTRIFEENYELLNDKLGEGCHGDVRKCIHKKSQQVYAVKMIRNGDTEIILSAITSFKIAKNLNHPSVIKPYELFINRETEKIFYVMEYCEYGSLQDYIENLWSLSPHKSNRTNKTRATSIDYLDDESNSLDSQRNLDFEESSAKVLQKQERRKKRSEKRKNKKKSSTKVNKEEESLIKLQQQLGSSDNLTQEGPKIQNKDQLITEDQDEAKQISHKAIEKNEGYHSGSKAERRKVQFTPYSAKVDQDTIKKILKEILLAVDYLHSEGICHRDLKPDNILVSSDCQRIKVIDFEISKQFKFFRQNRSGVLKTCEMWTRTGTQDFMSPEMFESTGYTEAVDIWAIGVIAYFLLTGRLPFDQEYISDKIEYIRNAQYNQEYMKDLEEIPKDFIRRMLRKDPRERLTAAGALSHPWFLVSSTNEPRNRNEITLNKSTVFNCFHSPQDSDKGSTLDSKIYQELNLIKGNQSTVLVKKDSSGSESKVIKQLNSHYLNKMQSQRNPLSNYSFSSKNSQSKIRAGKITSEFDGSSDGLQDLVITEGSSMMSESSTHISEKKRNFRMHNTEIGKSPHHAVHRNSKNGDIQYFKQSFFYDENSQKNAGDNSCRGLKSAQPPTNNTNTINFGDDLFDLHEIQQGENSCTSTINPRREEIDEGEESEKDDSSLRKKKEFRLRIQSFKEQMITGMSDLLSAKFIHINQKQFKHPPVSQLRLRLLQEKTLQKTNSTDKSAIQKIDQPPQIETNKSEYCKSSNQISLQNTLTQQPVLNGCLSFNSFAQSNINPSSTNLSNNTNPNINTNSNNPSNTECNNAYSNSQFGLNNNSQSNLQQIPSNVSCCTNNNICACTNSSTTNINNNFSNNQNNNNNNSNPNQQNSTSFTNINYGISANLFSGFPFEPSKLSPITHQLSTMHSNQQILNAQHFIDNTDIDIQSIRSRSNTNDLLEKNESEDQIETRAKRLSEDFTSSCIIQNPQRQQQIQSIMQQNLNSSQKNGSTQEGKVQKSSHFSMNQYVLAQSNASSANVLQSNSNFSIGSSRQLTIQEQLQLKPIKYVKEFLLSTGTLKEKEQSEQPITSKESVNNLETSINPFFKKIESDDDSPINDQSDTVFKRVASSNSSNPGLFQIFARDHKSNSDVCSIASDRHINNDQTQQKDIIKNDLHTQNDVIQSSSEESFQGDDEDEF